jgi:hypothetical protein
VKSQKHGNYSTFITTFIVTDSLKIGDYVLFKDVVRECHLSVEGILVEDLCGKKDLTSLHDSIFCIHLLRQYSASRELNTFLEASKEAGVTTFDESESKYLKALEVIFVIHCYFLCVICFF